MSNTTTNLTMGNNSNDQEYIDYSCSTSLERLARDVETAFHKWHITNGCDRHVSSSTQQRRSSNNNNNNNNSTNHDTSTTNNTVISSSNGTTTKNSSSWPTTSMTTVSKSVPSSDHHQSSGMARNGHNNSTHSRTSNINNMNGSNHSSATNLRRSSSSSSNTVLTAGTIMSTQQGQQSDTVVRKNPLLLRSEIITWNISFTTAANVSGGQPQRVTASNIVLQLALWDVPPTVAPAGTAAASTTTTRQSRSDKQSQNVKQQQQQQQPTGKSSQLLPNRNSESTTTTTTTPTSGSKSYSIPKTRITPRGSASNTVFLSPTTATKKLLSLTSGIPKPSRRRTWNDPSSMSSKKTGLLATLGNSFRSCNPNATNNYNSSTDSLFSMDDQGSISNSITTSMDENDDHDYNDDNEDDDDEEDHTMLPYSLRRQQLRLYTSSQRHHPQNEFATRNSDSTNNIRGIGIENDDLFSNFSFLFGVGQYITLSPVDPDAPLYQQPSPSPPPQQQQQSQSQSLDNTSSHTTRTFATALQREPTDQEPKDRIPSMLYEYISHSTVHRHLSKSKKATTNTNDHGTEYITSILSTWLQTALNVAAANSQCCFPLFGIWSSYQAGAIPLLSLSSAVKSKSRSTITIFPSWIEECRERMKLTEAANLYAQRILGRPKNQPFRNRGLNSSSSSSYAPSTMSSSSTTKRKSAIISSSASVFRSPPTTSKIALSSPLPRRSRSSSWGSQTTTSSVTGLRSSIVGPPLPNIANASFKINFLDSVPPLLSGKLLSDQCTSTFWLYALTSNSEIFRQLGNQFRSLAGIDGNNTLPRWTLWGSLLQQYCYREHQKRQQQQHRRTLRRVPAKTSVNVKNGICNQNVSSSTAPNHDDLTAFVNLWRARHTYCWHKSQTPKSGLQRLLWLGTNTSDTDWRPDPTATPAPDDDYRLKQASTKQQRRFIAYRNQCRQLALHRMEKAAGTSRSEPLWGPPDDPILSIHAILTWEGTTVENLDTMNNSKQRRTANCMIGQPLLALPLKSRHSMSDYDWKEMEDATESAILDINRPNRFTISIYYDHETAHASLAATQRCVVAALIRTATLPKETLLSHTIDESLMEKWDRAAGNKIAGILARKSGADSTTSALVAAMDWSTAVDDMIDECQTEEIIKNVFSMSTSSGNITDDADTSSTILSSSTFIGFPNPPEGFASNIVDMSQSSEDRGSSDIDGQSSGNQKMINLLWKPLQKGAPPGRLLSLLCLQMARVRTPCSMALVWITFCRSLRQRWDDRESLPNMRYVPGLDPLLTTYQTKVNDDGINPAHGPTSIGAIRANLAAVVNSSEPDPDNAHCLIGQKLQVFNIGVEILTTIGLYDDKATDNVEDTLEPFDENDFTRKPVCAQKLLSGEVIQRRSPIHDAASCSSNDDNDEFFDASETEVVNIDVDVGFERRLSRRRGARCPVQGFSLQQTGEQLYAPYLQRPFPLTDDVIAERKLMLYRSDEGMSTSFNTWQRLEIAHRLLKPKLLSDMQSFKAANPGATFHDFVTWYGNPNDPLAGDEKLLLHGNLQSMSETMVTNLAKAADAIRSLDLTREFWFGTWEEANPIPAIEQGPLFDAESTVEMALDYLENIHPASLLCQVVAVNLSSAYFALVASAGNTLRIRLVSASLLQLREKVEGALFLLSVDATRATGSLASNTNKTTKGAQQPEGNIGTNERNSFSDNMMMVSLEALAACSAACEALGQAEVLVSRAGSLLHKLSKQYGLVERILRRPEATPVPLTDFAAQEMLLESIHKRQKQIPAMNTVATTKLQPAIREYVLQNMDDDNPCQLSVRYSDEGSKVCHSLDESAQGTGIILALAKTSKTT